MTIDWWTLEFQTVNVVILIWLLQRFFWTPVAAMIAQRRTAASKALTDAEAARKKAEAALADIDKTRAGFASERDKILADARTEAERASTAKVAETTQQTASLIAAAKAAVAKDQVAAAKAWASRSSDLATDIAKRLATRLDGAVVRGIFLDWAVTAIRALPASTREAVTASASPLEASSATRLDPTEQSHAVLAIGEAFGAPVHVVFKTDPALIEGLELRTDHLVIGNSWRADIDAIRAGLAHEK